MGDIYQQQLGNEGSVTTMESSGRISPTNSEATNDGSGSVGGGGGGGRTYKEMLEVLKEVDKQSDEMGCQIMQLHLKFADLLVKSATLIEPELVKILHDCEQKLREVEGVLSSRNNDNSLDKIIDDNNNQTDG